MNWKYDDIMYEREDDSLKDYNQQVLLCIGQLLCILKRQNLQNSFLKLLNMLKIIVDIIKTYTSGPSIISNDYSFSVVPHMLGGFEDKAIPNFRAHCTKHLILMMSVSTKE